MKQRHAKSPSVLLKNVLRVEEVLRTANLQQLLPDSLYVSLPANFIFSVCVHLIIQRSRSLPF